MTKQTSLASLRSPSPKPPEAEQHEDGAEHPDAPALGILLEMHQKHHKTAAKHHEAMAKHHHGIAAEHEKMAEHHRSQHEELTNQEEG